MFNVKAPGLKVLADLFAVRRHALMKCLFFRFGEGERPDKPHCASCVQFVKAADHEEQYSKNLPYALREFRALDGLEVFLDILTRLDLESLTQKWDRLLIFPSIDIHPSLIE